jgi:hypothetical protein
MFIKIAGIVYHIMFKTQEEMQGNIGLAHFNDQEIWINNRFSNQTKKIALWHETLHILSDAFNLKMDEEQVKFTTHALLSLLEDNPEIVEQFKGM